MGYLITAHVFRDKPDLVRLAELPRLIGYRVYHHQAASVYLLDTFRPSKPEKYPFQTLLPAADLPLDLPSALEILDRLYSRLGPLHLANGFKRSYINAALLLSRLLQMPVFSFASDDDDLDFTCSASDGVLNRLKCRCGDLVIFYDLNTLKIVPLVPVCKEDEDLLSDTTTLKATLPEATILPRETPWNTQLHAIAIEELQKFMGVKQSILGLGHFDPPEDESDWKVVASR